MKKICEGVSGITLLFYLIIVSGGFLFGTKSHYDKAKQRRKLEKKYEKKLKRYEERLQQEIKQNQEYQKLEDPRWHYYDEVDQRFKPIPGDFNKEPPPPPTKSFDETTNKSWYLFSQQVSPDGI